MQRPLASPDPAHGRVEDVAVGGTAGGHVDDGTVREDLGLAGVSFGRLLARGEQERGTLGVRCQVGSDPARCPEGSRLRPLAHPSILPLESGSQSSGSTTSKLLWDNPESRDKDPGGALDDHSRRAEQTRPWNPARSYRARDTGGGGR